MRNLSSESRPATITIKVSGKLFVGHLAYLDQLVETAADCELWPLLSLQNLNELDRAALFYLVNGEGRNFTIVSCPDFIQRWMDHEKSRSAVATHPLGD